MSARQFLASLTSRGVRLSVDHGQLRIRSPKGVLSQDELGRLQAEKQQLLALLSSDLPSSIGPRPEECDVPLTPSQQKWWDYIHEEQAGRSERLCYVASRIRGELRTDLLQSCVDALLQRHEVLRTTVVPGLRGRLCQRVVGHLSTPMDIVDLCHLPAAQIQSEARRVATCFIQTRINPSVEPLIAVRLFKLAPEEHILILALEHLIADGESIALLHHELWDLYGGALAGLLLQTGRATLQFADYAYWLDRSSSRLAPHEQYWSAKLRDVPRVQIPFIRDVPDGDRPACVTHTIRFGTERTDLLKGVAKEERTVLAIVVSTIFVASLARWCDQRDFTVEFVSDGKFYPELEHVAGYFAAFLRLRVTLRDDETLSSLLRQIQTELSASFAHHDFGYTPYSPSKSRVELDFNWTRNVPVPAVPRLGSYAGALPRIESYPLELSLSREFLPLFFDTDDGVVATVTYRPDRFAPGAIAGFGTSLLRFADYMIGERRRCAMSLPIEDVRLTTPV